MEVQSIRYIMSKDSNAIQAIMAIMKEYNFSNMEFIKLSHMIDSVTVNSFKVPYEIHEFENQDQLFVYFIPKRYQYQNL